MIYSNKRKVNLLLFLTAIIFISVAATKPSATAIKPTHIATNDTSIFKNLKVLPQDITKDSLDHLMHQFTAALGVKCNFCHVFNNGKMDFVTDEKPEKDVARYMYHMTGEINAKFFNMDNSTRPDTLSVIRCVTCHRGSPHPDEVSAPAPQGNMPPPGDSSHKMPVPPPGDTSHKMQAPPPNQK
jgi:hypothetical protein